VFPGSERCYGDQNKKNMFQRRGVFPGRERCYGDQSKIKRLWGSVMAFMAVSCNQSPSELLRDVRI